MISLILFILIGIELNMMHGLYLCLIIIELILNIISFIVKCIEICYKMFWGVMLSEYIWSAKRKSVWYNFIRYKNIFMDKV